MEIPRLFFPKRLFSNLLQWHGSRGVIYWPLVFYCSFSLFFRVHVLLPLSRLSGVFLVFTRWNTEACGGSDQTGHSENFRNRALLSSFLLARSFLWGRMDRGVIVPLPVYSTHINLFKQISNHLLRRKQIANLIQTRGQRWEGMGRKVTGGSEMSHCIAFESCECYYLFKIKEVKMKLRKEGGISAGSHYKWLWGLWL